MGKVEKFCTTWRVLTLNTYVCFCLWHCGAQLTNSDVSLTCEFQKQVIDSVNESDLLFSYHVEVFLQIWNEKPYSVEYIKVHIPLVWIPLSSARRHPSYGDCRGHRGGCLELYYCNMVEWFWWVSSLISTTNWFPSVLWHCWFGHLACKNLPRNDL